MSPQPHDWKRGMRRLSPGLYVDGANIPHLDLEELCTANGYPYNEHNAAMLKRVLFEIAEDLWPGLKITEVDA